MPNLVRLLLLWLACLSALGSSAATEPLRIVAWNLEWFPGGKPDATPAESQRHMQAAQKAMATLNPDVLLLQEVRDWAAAAELCKVVPSLKVQVASAFPDRPQNLVIASTIQADSGWSELWKADPANPPRGYSFAALPLPGNRFLLAYSLHLKSNLGQLPANIAARHASVRQLLAHVQEMLAIYSKRGKCAVVIGGDLNTSLDDPRFLNDYTLPALRNAGLHWTHEGVPPAKRVTIPAEGQFPDNTFDHIFTTGLGKITASVLPQPGVSDHNPVLLLVDLAKVDFNTVIDVQKGLASLPTVPALAPAVLPGTLAATQTADLVAAAGKRVVVSGKVSRVGATQTGSIHFINFEGTKRGEFVVIVRKANVEAIQKAFGISALQELAGKAVRVEGEVSIYQGAPQIELKRAEELKVQLP